jgi:ribosome maturation factor RimP
MEFSRIREIARRALSADAELFDLHVRRVRNGYHIQIELDGLKDPAGSVSLDECERYSKAFIELLDQSIGQDGLPDDLDAENYSLEVSSAGAERELRIPKEFERFRGRPLKIRYRTDDERIQVGHGIFDAMEGTKIRFFGFVPRASKKGRVRNPEPFTLELDRIEKVNLYLDV